MRDHGRENRGGEDGTTIVASVRVRERGARSGGEDLVFDLSGMDEMTVKELSVLLTAQQLASREDRAVWATGVAAGTWHALRTMGLTDYLKPFPGEVGNAA